MGAGVADKPLATIHAPLTVLPTQFPRGSFEKAKAAMQLFNTLIDRVSQDEEYLQTTLRPAAEYDDFTVSDADMISTQHMLHRKPYSIFTATLLCLSSCIHSHVTTPLEKSVCVESCQCIIAHKWGCSAFLKALHTMMRLCKVCTQMSICNCGAATFKDHSCGNAGQAIEHPPQHTACSTSTA